MTENSLLSFMTCSLILGVPQSPICIHCILLYFILYLPVHATCRILVPQPGTLGSESGESYPLDRQGSPHCSIFLNITRDDVNYYKAC